MLADNVDDKPARASIAPQSRFYCLGGALLFGPVKSTDLTDTIADRYEVELMQVLVGNWSEPTWLGASPAFWQSSATWFNRLEPDLFDVDAPLLYLAGDLDFNVWPEHLDQYARWSAERPGLDLTTELFPDLTHAFVPLVSGTPPVGFEIDPRFSPEVIARIVDWMKMSAGAEP